MTPSKRIITTVEVLLLIGISTQVLFDPFSSAKHALEVARVRAEFPAARAKWDAQKRTDYRFEIRTVVPFVCQPHAMIEVENEAVVKVETISPEGLQLLPPEKWADPDWGNEVFLCDYINFTMPQIFDLLAETIRMDPSVVLGADFDPDYGFITNFRYGLFFGHGLLNPRITDTETAFTIEDFQPSLTTSTSRQAGSMAGRHVIKVLK